MRRREFIAGLTGVAAWPLAAQAQRPTVPVIGFLSFGFPNPNAEYVVAFRQGLADAGYVAGRNVTIEYRWANAQGAALRPLAAELVERQVAAIVAVGGSNGVPLAAKAATSTIPIVFEYGADPIKDGLVAGFNRPGGNTTGVASFNIQLVGKRFGLLCDLVPRARIIAYLSGTSTYGNYEEQRSEILAAARVQGRQVIILEVRDDRDYEAAFKTLIQGQAEGLVVGAFTFRNLNRILALSADHKVPTIYPNSGSVAAGGLMSYGAVIFDIYRQIGIICRSDSQGRKARRTAGGAADQVRAGHQPQDRKGAGHRGARNAVGHRRQGNWRRAPFGMEFGANDHRRVWRGRSAPAACRRRGRILERHIR
jgi:putative tryptophan/tyrosine transport system substrate-binding protein